MAMAAAWGIEPSLPMVQPADGRPFSARLVDISQNGTIVLEGDGQQVTFPLHRWVAWGTPAEPRRAPFILLADESLIVCDSISVAGQRVDVQTSSLGSFSFGTELLRGIVLILPSDRLASDRSIGRVFANREDSDQLMLTNGDRARGKVVEFSGGKIEFESQYGTLRVDGAQVSAMIFRQGLADRVATSPLGMLAGLQDGSLLRASRLNREGSTVALELESGIELKIKDPADVVYVQPLRGGVVYLSDLVPITDKHVSYLSMAWPYQNDRNVLGGRLRGGGRIYTKGLGTHSEAQIVYRLDQPYRRFDAELAVDDHTAGQGSVVFRVSLLSGEAWKAVYSSAVVRGGDAPVPVSVDLAGATEISLHVDFAERGDVQDVANWLNARFVK
jgi:hypothetical protein